MNGCEIKTRLSNLNCLKQSSDRAIISHDFKRHPPPTESFNLMCYVPLAASSLNGLDWNALETLIPNEKYLRLPNFPLE